MGVLTTVLPGEVVVVGIEAAVVEHETMRACNVEGREYAASHMECAAVPGGGNRLWADLCK